MRLLIDPVSARSRDLFYIISTILKTLKFCTSIGSCCNCANKHIVCTGLVRIQSELCARKIFRYTITSSLLIDRNGAKRLFIIEESISFFSCCDLNGLVIRVLVCIFLCCDLVSIISCIYLCYRIFSGIQIDRERSVLTERSAFIFRQRIKRNDAVCSLNCRVCAVAVLSTIRSL